MNTRPILDQAGQLREMARRLNLTGADLEHVLKVEANYGRGVRTWPNGATRPGVDQLRVAITANTAPTTVEAFDAGTPGQLLVVAFKDGNTTLQEGPWLRMAAGVDFTGAAGDRKLFITLDGLTFDEVPKP